MDDKTLTLLEFPKILDRLAERCTFSASSEKARALRPVDDIIEARRRQQVTAEALQFLMTHPDFTIGGARDVRMPVDLARRGGVLSALELLDVRQTLIAARTVGRSFERLQVQFPALFDIVTQLAPPGGLIDAIGRAVSERGDVLDSASDKLAQIRRDLRVVHDRLMAKLQRMVGDPRNAPYLQESLITTRDGRYVIPLRSEFKGRIRSIVHDQSSSGATLFVEPLTVVDQNNQYRELQLGERDEVRRILAELSSQVGLHGDAIIHTVDVIGDLDLALACGILAEDQHAQQPVLHAIDTKPIQQSRHPGSVIRLYQARHPLLDPKTVVAIDVELDPQTYALIITGPNTGGKTVALKTVGLLALMAQAGLHIPALSGSEISVFNDIYADIGDEQSIEQSLSTFSGHITNIKRILEMTDRQALIILDELGAGTDPQEGSALARAIMAHLLERGITTLVTTHHPELKAYAHATPGVVNASVEFDLQTLRPTFRLTIGLPGRSNAVAIAERLGLPKRIIAEARREINPDDLRAEDLLNEIHQQRDQSRQARAATEQARLEAEALRRELIERLERIEDERRTLLEQTRQEGAAQVAQLQEEITQARKALARARQPVEALKEIEAKAEELEAVVEAPVERSDPELGPTLQKLEGERRRALRAGDKVRLRSLGMVGVITSLGQSEAEVAVGALRVRARLGDLERYTTAAPPPLVESSAVTAAGRGDSSRARKRSPGTGDAPAPAAPPRAVTPSGDKPKQIYLAASPGMELDLRGLRADDALEKLDRYLDAAFLAGMPFVRIIHGKGTGKLRESVREALRNHHTVKSYEGGGDKEGGEGVTVAKLATS